MKFDTIHNYYEQLVVRHIMDKLVGGDNITDEDFLQDVACVALNYLPARYVRYDVDTAFYLSLAERSEMEKEVGAAVERALEFVSKHPNGQEQGDKPITGSTDKTG